MSDRQRPLIMGILNLTPDSFSDGGKFMHPDAAVDHAVRMVEEGADIIDIGGESTRPGAQRASVEDQIQRVIPVIEGIRQQVPPHIRISIDTTHTAVVAKAIEQGATIINDISAGRDDPAMFELAADSGSTLILMHMQGEPETMQQAPYYDDAITEIRGFLVERAQAARTAGVKQDRIIIDPGIGFGKTAHHNKEIIANLRAFIDTGYPVLLGASRKSFLRAFSLDVGLDDLSGATCATTVLGVMAGVHMLRVHDVNANRQAAEFAREMMKYL